MQVCRCLRIWKGLRRTLDLFINELNDNGKDVFLESELKVNQVLNLLAIIIKRKIEEF